MDRPRGESAETDRWIGSLRRAYDRFVRIRGDAREIAMGFALGLFVGMTPFMGFHMAAAIFLAALFKANKIAAATGAWITNPLTAPILYGATYVTGTRILGIRRPPPLPKQLDMEHLIEIVGRAPEIFWILTVGGLILGIPAAIAGYGIAYAAISKYREDLRIKRLRERGRLALEKKAEKRRKKLRRRKPRSRKGWRRER